MVNAKIVNVLLAAHYVLSKEQSHKTAPEIAEMKKVSYFNAVGSVMYLMVSTRHDIAYAISSLSKFMANPGKLHWE
ncbi:hypothetical protein ACS0TY_034453 [Phlomoides rotata]